MKKAIIFDMDGVIIQSEILYQQRRAAFFNEHNLPLDDDFQHKVIGSNPKDMFTLLFPDSTEKRDFYLAKYQLFKEEFTIDYEQILTDNVEEVLMWLKHQQFKIALASSGDYSILQKILHQTNLKPYFDVIVSGADMKQSKPAPDVYLEAMKQLECQPQECVAIEDSTYGIRAAISAGIDCLALKPTAFDIDQRLATKIILSLNDIPSWLTS